MSPNVLRNKRGFSETKWKKNLGEARAERWTVYLLLYEGERNEVEWKHSVPLSFFTRRPYQLQVQYQLAQPIYDTH